MAFSTATENMVYLKAHYFQGLMSLHPKTILDVGCGSGEILQRCRDHGIAATGLESTSRELDDLPQNREDFVFGQAHELPFCDQSFDWVCMRHVPHHLPQPELAFLEALRVAQTGFYVAEPWFDPSLPRQQASEQADLWLKRQHRRTGMVHRPNYDLAGLMQLLPAEFHDQVEVEIMQRLHERDVDEFLQQCEPWLQRLPVGHQDLQAFEELRATLKRTGMGWNGSIVLTVRITDTAISNRRRILAPS